MAPLPPSAELQWWYQFYFATERGRAGYDKYRRDFTKLIWQLASPKWKFDDATFARSATSFDNPDHVAIVIHNYRWRLGLAEGESKYDEYEKKLAGAPVIPIPTITMEGDANGAPHPEPSAYRGNFQASTSTGTSRGHRSQPSSGGAGGVRQGCHRRRPFRQVNWRTGASRRSCQARSVVAVTTGRRRRRAAIARAGPGEDQMRTTSRWAIGLTLSLRVHPAGSARVRSPNACIDHQCGVD